MAIDFNMGAAATKTLSATDDFGEDYFGVQHMENSRVKLRRFSKCWDVGSQITAFYPFRLVRSKQDPDKMVWVPVMSAVWGHNVPYTKGSDSPSKALHRSFVRSRCSLTADGDVVGAGDLAYQFSRIAPLLVRAMKEKELNDLASDPQWKQLGEAAYARQRQTIEEKYDPKKMNSVKPFLSRLTLQCNTVCYVVAMDANLGTPIFETQDTDKTQTGVFTQTLSQGRKDKLMKMANSPQFGINAQHVGGGKTYAEGDVEFLEVMYNFLSVRMDKSEAGRTDPQGIAEAISLAKRFPADAAKIKQGIDSVPTTRDEIRSRLYAMEPMEDAALLQALQQYTMTTVSSWKYLNDEDKDRLLNNADIIDFLRIAPSDEELNKAFTERLGHPVGKSTAAAPTIEGLVGSDEKFDVSTQAAAVDTAVTKAEQGEIPDGFGDDPSAAYAGELEV